MTICKKKSNMLVHEINCILLMDYKFTHPPGAAARDTVVGTPSRLG
jgi:hypothetical protein